MISASLYVLSVALLFVAAKMDTRIGGLAEAYSRHEPYWPEEFQAEFYSRWKATDGIFAVQPHREAIILRDGSRDHLCSAYHTSTPCSIITAMGWKYLVWPELQQCCRCCSYSSGCGPLGKRWVSNATGNVEYLQVAAVRYSARELYKCHKWAVVGLSKEHPNYYYQHLHSWKPCEVDGANYLRKPSEIADDQYIFRLDSITRVVNASLFRLPSYCNGDKFCGKPVCDDPPVSLS